MAPDSLNGNGISSTPELRPSSNTGQGIGLWFVTWAVTKLGGDLRIRENDLEGSIVTIRLYETVR